MRQLIPDTTQNPEQEKSQLYSLTFNIQQSDYFCIKLLGS